MSDDARRAVTPPPAQVELDLPWRRATPQSRSQRQEERLAKRPGGGKQINSGRFWHSKRDGRQFQFLIEARTTEAGSYRVSEEEFQKIKKDAYATPPGLLPCLQIEFRSDTLDVVRHEDLESLLVTLAAMEAYIESLESTD